MYKKKFQSFFLFFFLLSTVICDYNTEYAKSWKWVNPSRYASSIKDNDFHGYSKSVMYANLPSGIEVKDDGTLWSFDIQKELKGTYVFCIGLQVIENFGYKDTRKDSDWQYYVPSIAACSDKAYYNGFSSTHTVISPMDYDKVHEGKYDGILLEDKFIVTNERYGRNTKIEFTIDPTRKYFPYVYFYTDSPVNNFIIRFNSCFQRCSTCQDWNPSECLTCKQTTNTVPAPSCECNPGFTHYYNNQSNEVCQAEQNYKIIQPSEWEWQSNVSNKQPVSERLEVGQFSFDSGVNGIYVPISGGLKSELAGTKWTIKLVDTPTNNEYVCFGMQIIDHELKNLNYGSSTSVCTESNAYKSNSLTQTINGKINGIASGIKNMNFDFIFTDTTLTITSIPYHGTTDVVFEYDTTKIFQPWVGLELQSTVQVNKCNPRCLTCEFMQPNICLTCSDSSNREQPPQCACISGKQDTYRKPNIHKIHSECIQNYEYYVPQPPEWNWVSESDKIIEKQGGIFTTFNGYTHTYVYLGNDGIRVKQDGTKWSVKIINHEYVSSGPRMCLGIQKTERYYNFNWNTSTIQGALICTNNAAIIQQDAISVKQVGDLFPAYESINGMTFDFIYQENWLIITDEAYGGKIRYEFELYNYLNYYPIIFVYSGNVLQEQVFQVHNCSKRCLECPLFQPTKCISCQDSINRPATPDCLCKAGMEDYYYSKYNEECRVVPQWNEPKPPEWIWESESDVLYEDIDIDQDKFNMGVFRSLNKNHNKIKLKNRNIVNDHTKWTVKILQHHSAHVGNIICFGVIKQELDNEIWKEDDRGKSVSQCTNNVAYNAEMSGQFTKFGEMKHQRDQSGETYDIYYERHLLIISNEDHGGYYRIEFPLKEDVNYTPYLHHYGYEGIIQVKGCSNRCKTCYDWDPERCIECNNNDNRYPAPSCKCIENYNDVFEGELQNYCQKVEYYNEMKPPQWRWMSESTGIEEDIANKKENYGTFSAITTYGSFVVEGMPIIENYSKYTVQILNHHRTGQLCMGVIEAQRSKDINFNAWSSPNSSCFDTYNQIYNKDGFSGQKTKTKILYESPRNDRESLKGEIFEVFYKRDLLTVTNENYRGSKGGRLIKAEIELNPDLNYMPFIGSYQPYMKIQLKGCSKRCSTCLDWKPRQCLTCSDIENRLFAPCCLCKSNMEDYYNYTINEKCIATKNYRTATYPEMNWKIISPYPLQAEFQDDMGTFICKDDHTYDIGPENFILTEPIQWEFNIKTLTSDRNIFIGIQKADVNVNENVDLAIGVVTNETTRCSKSQGCKSVNVIQGIPADEAEALMGGKIMCIYEPNLFRVTTLPYGGDIDYEFEIDPNVIYIPYARTYGYMQVIQVKSCNQRCGTCKDWFPNECYTCKGANRDIAPTCGCLPGYTDEYHNIQNIDCRLNVQHEHPHPSNWVFQSKSTKTTNLGNGLWSTINGYGKIYADLGFEGINGQNGGTKWSVQFYDLETTGSYTCIGIAKNEKLLTMTDEGNNYAQVAGFCEEQEIYDGSVQIQRTIIENETISIGDMQQQIFDFHYEQGFLKISNTAYGGHKHIELEIIKEIDYFPVIINHSNSINSNQIVNVRPCHHKCLTCNNVVSTILCTVCSHEASRNAPPMCDCKDGYYENPDGYYKCMHCDGNCETCTGPAQCTSCKISPNRNNSPPNCSCLKGFFEDYNFNCQPCDYQCEECAGESDKCSKCKVELYRNQVDCTCLEGYFEDSITQSCIACPSQCKQCKDASGICTECACDRVYFDGTNSSCPCPDNAFGVSENSGQCQICSPPCKTCVGETQCLTCIFGGTNRYGPPSCSCELGYYEDSFNNCKKCVEGCAKCEVFAYRCLLCIVDPNRKQDPTDCSCIDGYITSPDTGKCVLDTCPDKCNTCQQGSNTQCQACKESLTRKDITENCECLDTHYDIGSLECKPCQLPCLKCSDETTCISCITSQGRNPTPDCSCLDGYYEDAGNNCIKCHYKCIGCQGSAEGCKQCKIEPNRETSGQCNCKQGFNEDPLTQSCVEMTTCAVSCQTCNLNTPDICLSCSQELNTNRLQIQYNCQCKDGYYDNNTPFCQKCQEPCQNCYSNTICISCSITGENRLGAPSCGCQQGYIEDANKNCIFSALCPQEEGRKSSGDCSCLEGYFENDLQICEKCLDECKSCTNNTECTSCSLGYKSNSIPNCIQCDILCDDCLDNTNICTTCKSGRHNPPSCECMSGYYDDGINPECQQCNVQCGSCSGSPDNCTICKGQLNKKYELPNCKCWEGYYQDNATGNCLPCNYNCLTCSEKPDKCIICREGKDRILQAPACACKPGTFETQYNNNCEYCSQQCQVTESIRILQEIINENIQYSSCSSLCKSCNKNNQCQVCLPGKNTTMIPPSCECLQGYYLDAIKESCQKCDNNCLKCNSLKKCNLCSDNMIVNNLGKCQCKKNTFYSEKINQCLQCVFYQGKCLKKCPEGTQLYFNSLTECIDIEILRQQQQQNQDELFNSYNIGCMFIILIIVTIIIQNFLMKLI